MPWSIYKITNQINNKIYVGITMLNFPDELANYLNKSFKLPECSSFEKKTVKHKNISFESGCYRLYIENGAQKFRPSFKTLEEAIEERNKILISLGRKIPLEV